MARKTIKDLDDALSRLGSQGAQLEVDLQKAKSRIRELESAAENNQARLDSLQQLKLKVRTLLEARLKVTHDIEPHVSRWDGSLPAVPEDEHARFLQYLHDILNKHVD